MEVNEKEKEEENEEEKRREKEVKEDKGERNGGRKGREVEGGRQEAGREEMRGGRREGRQREETGKGERGEGRGGIEGLGGRGSIFRILILLKASLIRNALAILHYAPPFLNPIHALLLPSLHPYLTHLLLRSSPALESHPPSSLSSNGC